MVFSGVPRCQGWRGSAKNTGTPVATLNWTRADKPALDGIAPSIASGGDAYDNVAYATATRQPQPA